MTVSGNITESTNAIIIDLCQDNINIRNLTLIDKYIIFVYLYMISVGTTLRYSLTCAKCEHKSDHMLNLNDIIIPIKSILDKKYEKQLLSGDYLFSCNIPTIGVELDTMEWRNINDPSDLISANRLLEIINHITNIQFNKTETDWPDLSIGEKMKLISAIPRANTACVQKKFIQPVTRTLVTTKTIAPECPECKTSTAINMGSINDILYFLLVNPPDTFIENILFLSKNYNIPPTYSEQLTISDLSLFKQVISENNTQSVDTTEYQL